MNRGRRKKKEKSTYFFKSVDINPTKRVILITGYIHRHHGKHTKDHKQFPNELVGVMLQFYPFHEILFAETGNKKFIKTRESSEYNPSSATGLLNTVFTDKMCDEFTIKFRINKNDSFQGLHIYFGYLYEWEQDKQPSAPFPLGLSETSFGVLMRAGKSHGIHPHPPSVMINGIPQHHQSTQEMDIWSIITMVFDFKHNSLGIYHNDDYLCVSSLKDRKCIIPGVSVDSGMEIEFIECSFN